MAFTLIKETLSLQEEQMMIDSIALFEEVAKAMQPYVALINSAADGSMNPFDKADKKVKKPIPVEPFAAFLAGLSILSDRETRRNSYAEDFGSVKKDFEFLSSVGRDIKKFGENENQTAQQRIIEIGKSAKTLWKEFSDRLNNWADEKVRTKLVAEIKKLVNEWDRQMNSIKTEYNKTQVSKI